MQDLDLPEGYRLSVRHFHDENDTFGMDRVELREEVYHGEIEVEYTPRYATEAYILDRDGVIVTHAVAVCAPNDTPCRKRGYEIATRRCLKAFNMMENN